MNKDALACPLENINWLVVNEIEGAALTGKIDADDILNDLKQRYPSARTVLTLGSKGLRYVDPQRSLSVPAFSVNAVDTTGTGDTFTGFFLAALVKEKALETALAEASAAAAICATRQGAASSIPDLREVQQFLQNA
jgi:ribokinase